MREKTVIKNGFEYYTENISGTWYYHFRPVGAPIFAAGEGPKSRFLEFLAGSDEAIRVYLKQLAAKSDVTRAEVLLASAQAFHAKVKSPDWDPGGNTNNPGKVSRALREAADSEAAVVRAQHAVAAATSLSNALKEHPFDVAAWTAQYSSPR